MRTDVRRRLEQASQLELDANGNHIVLISRPLADQLRVWSAPVQVRVDPGPAGIVELVVRAVPTEEVAA